MTTLKIKMYKFAIVKKSLFLTCCVVTVVMELHRKTLFDNKKLMKVVTSLFFIQYYLVWFSKIDVKILMLT